MGWGMFALFKAAVFFSTTAARPPVAAILAAIFVAIKAAVAAHTGHIVSSSLPQQLFLSRVLASF
jgi:hypothetical protein